MLSHEAVNTQENKAEDENDQTQRDIVDKRSFTAVICFAILVVFWVGWAFVACYALSTGNPGQLVYPTNSEGELCGRGNQTGKPNLLYFDLTQCAGLAGAQAGCPTPQVCVEECPVTYWNSAQGKSSSLALFCAKLTPGQLEDANTSMSQLVVERSCPAYLLPSKPVQGRCVPTFALVKREETGRAEVKINAIKTEDGEILQVESLLAGVDYVMEIVEHRGIGMKLFTHFSAFWWIVIMSFILALVLSLIWTLLINLVARPVLWTSIVLCHAILVAGTVFSLIRYWQLRTGREDIFIPPVIASMSSYLYNKNSWLVCGIIIAVINVVMCMVIVLNFKYINIAIKLIEEAITTVRSTKSVLLIPIGQSLVQVVIILMFVIVGSFLVTSGDPEYGVVGACSSETCINEVTEKMFMLNDVCNPSTFAECTGCPIAQCLYHKHGPSVLGSWLQVWNFCGMFWLLLFVQSLGCMARVRAHAKLYQKEVMSEDLKSMWMQTSLKRTCSYHLGTPVFGSLIPTVCCMKSDRCLRSGNVTLDVDSDSIRRPIQRFVCFPARNSDRFLCL